MKHLLFILFLIPSLAYAQGAYPVENICKEVRPGDNFMLYAAGGWLDKNPLREDERFNGAFKSCEDSVTLRMSHILTDLLIHPQKPGTIEDYVSILFRQYSDTTQRNSLGLTPIMADLKAIRQAKDKKELQGIMARLDRRGNKTLLFEWEIRPNYLQAQTNIVAIQRYALNMPATCYEGKKDEQKAIRDAYIKLGRDLFQTLGYDTATAKIRMQQVFDLELQLCQSHFLKGLERFSNQDIHHSVHLMSRDELARQYKEIDWATVFSTSHGPMDVRQVDVTFPKALEIACDILKKNDLDVLKSLVELRLIWANARLLTQDLRRGQNRFNAVVLGKAADPAQWKSSANFLSYYLAMPMGQLYCNRYFKPEYKVRIQTMVHHITEAFRHRIKQNTWMSAHTKQEALRKLDNVVWLIAYPDIWDTTEGLKISRYNTLSENISLLLEYQNDRHIAQCLNRPVDRQHWTTPPQTVNAFNKRAENCIYLPAGILQPPFFDPDADEAINYGSIGTVIAHELTHGYDPEGCQFDSIGNVRNWWTPQDMRAYTRRTKVLKQHFDHVKYGGENINGAQTLSENVSDNGGLQIALEAMQRAGIRHSIDGQTAAQRFFLGFARLYAHHTRPKYLWFIIHNDTHTPAGARINGSLPHIDAWYEAFNVSPKDSLYLPAHKRARIW